jgi:outer membrane lipoprotein SlyB
MVSTRKIFRGAALAAVCVAMTACASPRGQNTAQYDQYGNYRGNGNPDCANGTNYGAAALGAVAGGLLGSTVGGGTGRIVAAGAGAATGAVVGNNLGCR